jgi:hypothetical protein
MADADIPNPKQASSQYVLAAREFWCANFVCAGQFGGIKSIEEQLGCKELSGR